MTNDDIPKIYCRGSVELANLFNKIRHGSFAIPLRDIGGREARFKYYMRISSGLAVRGLDVFCATSLRPQYTEVDAKTFVKMFQDFCCKYYGCQPILSDSELNSQSSEEVSSKDIRPILTPINPLIIKL